MQMIEFSMFYALKWYITSKLKYANSLTRICIDAGIPSYVLRNIDIEYEIFIKLLSQLW